VVTYGLYYSDAEDRDSYARLLHDDMFSCSNRTPDCEGCEGRTDGETIGHRAMAHTALA